MIEKNYKFNRQNEKLIEKVVDDDNVVLNHMILTNGTGLPEHYSNSYLYMIIVRGIMTLKLEEQQSQKYTEGQVISIPYNTKMNVNNSDDEILEFFVVKAPNPKHFK
jgi:quercetin dioxygenase-like cupin family protein